MTAQQQGVLSDEEVEAFAHEALNGAGWRAGVVRPLIQRIAAAAAEKERERCAGIVEDLFLASVSTLNVRGALAAIRAAGTEGGGNVKSS